MSVNLDLSVFEGGREWKLFLIDFTTADGEFSTYIYALSFEHANYLVEELRNSARVAGQIESSRRI